MTDAPSRTGTPTPTGPHERPSSQIPVADDTPPLPDPHLQLGGPIGNDPGAVEQVGAGAAATAAADGTLNLRQASLWGDAWRQLRRKPLFLLPALVIFVLAVMAVFPGLFTRVDPRNCDLARSLVRPGTEHVFGFDQLGCNYYARVVYGARVSMAVGGLVVLGAGFIGIVLGAVAGYYGGVVDTIVARITDVSFGIPTVLGAILILSLFRNRGLLQVALVLVALGWPTFLRLMRSQVLQAKELDYVQAAKSLGGNDLRILARHILPNAIAPVIVYGTITVGVIVAAEATLSFLGVGLQTPAISWGLMISDAQRLILQAPHLLLFPGGFLSVTVLSFILMGDALRDALDPRLR